jgi:acetyltransferase
VADGLDRLLKPKSVAVVGASPNPSFVSGIFRNVVRYFEGSAYPVNPNYPEVAGRRCYPSLAEVPEPVDHVVVGVPGRLLPRVLADCEASRAGALNVISSGFAELAGDQGHQRQQELRAWAERTGIRVVGPNCLGLISTPGKLWALPGWYDRVQPGPIAVVLQSGQMASSIATPLSDRGIGFTYIVSSGNEADLEAADFVSHFLDDPQTRVIGVFVEQFRTPARLIAVAERAADLGKPIIALKIGRSEAARGAARAHTGSLVGSDRVVDALLRQHGITRVSSVDEMLEALAIFHAPRLPRGDGVAAIFVSGGAVGLAHDLATQTGVGFARLDEPTAARLKEVVPEYGSVGNPLDITGQGVFDAPIFEGAVAALAEAPGVDTILYGRGFPARLDKQGPVGRVLTEAVEKYPDRLFLVFSLVGGELHPWPALDPPIKEPIAELGGVPFLQGTEYTLKAVAALNRYAAFQRERAGRNGGRPGRVTPPATRERARKMLEALLRSPHPGRPHATRKRVPGGDPLPAAEGARAPALTEREGKQLLALYGIGVTREVLARDARAAAAAAGEIGYPVVMKVESPDIVHKTDVGAIRLGVDGPEAAARAFEEIVASARAHAPGADVRGVLVQEQVVGGVETILGMTVDADYGPCVVFGLGGILVEVLDDLSLGLPPLGEREAREMVDRLRGRRLLDGPRGAPAADVGAALDAIRRFADMALDLADLVEEIDVNPFVLLPEGGRALDCLIVPRRRGTDG